MRRGTLGNLRLSQSMLVNERAIQVATPTSRLPVGRGTFRNFSFAIIMGGEDRGVRARFQSVSARHGATATIRTTGIIGKVCPDTQEFWERRTNLVWAAVLADSENAANADARESDVTAANASPSSRIVSRRQIEHTSGGSSGRGRRVARCILFKS